MKSLFNTDNCGIINGCRFENDIIHDSECNCLICTWKNCNLQFGNNGHLNLVIGDSFDKQTSKSRRRQPPDNTERNVSTRNNKNRLDNNLNDTLRIQEQNKAEAAIDFGVIVQRENSTMILPPLQRIRFSQEQLSQLTKYYNNISRRPSRDDILRISVQLQVPDRCIKENKTGKGTILI
ncbi:hypothetical protein GJ496_001394 [Pomphorhynchus laevis]|nr:hypothetical protein GJ496_001394 [Pomphorhynchus laevis]